MGFSLNKGEFRDVLKLRYDWEIADKPSICVCGDAFNVDHAMVCRRGGFIIQRHNELRDLEADMLSMVCNDIEIEPILQELTESPFQAELTELPTLAYPSMPEVFENLMRFFSLFFKKNCA